MKEYPDSFLYYVFEIYSDNQDWSSNYWKTYDNYEYGISLADFMNEYPNEVIEDAKTILSKINDHNVLILNYKNHLKNQIKNMTEKLKIMEKF
jgi:hypothetical protein